MTIETIHFASGIGRAERVAVPFGLNVEEMAMRVHGSLENLVAFVRAPAGYVDEWIEIPRAAWRTIKPKISGVVMFGYRLGKSFLRTVFSVIAAVVVAVIAPYLAPVLGTIGAGLAAAAIGIGARLAINALFPADQPSLGVSGVDGGAGTSSASQSITPTSSPKERARQFSNIESDSNLLAKESYLPIVVGTRRISPPEIVSPFLFLENGVQTIQRVFAVEGHHSISEIQVDRTPITNLSSITTEIRDGAEATPITTFVTKSTKLYQIGETLSTFSLDGTDLVDQVTPSYSEPRWVRFPTIYDPKMEEISIRLQIDSIIKTDSAEQSVRIPLRLRFRPKGSDAEWWNFPEVHIVGRDVSTSLKEIRVRWDSNFGGADAAGDLSYQFFKDVTQSYYPLSDNSVGSQWSAHTHFVAGPDITETQNIQGRRNGIRITLNDTDFPKGEYEWEIIRGIAMNSETLDVATYGISGEVNSLFIAQYKEAKWQVPIDQGSYIGRVTCVQATTITDRQPCQRPKTALLAVKSRGMSVKNVTALMSRYVHDWDGTGWNTLTTTSNPATHYRQVLFDYLTYHGISTNLIANDQLVAWRSECESRGYEVSAVFAGSSVRETLDAISVAGYARSRYSDGFGVDYFRDRSAERPVQTFSPRNSSISLQWVSGEKPVGIRATFNNEDDDYRADEIQINNPFYSNFTGYEVKNYATITNKILVRRRAFFDMLQAYYQGRRAWQVDASIEGMICERGDLVGIVTDLIDDTNSGARVREVISDTTFRIDQLVPSESTTDLFQIDNVFLPTDMFTVGEQTVCLMSTPTGTEQRTVVAAEGDIIRVSEPFSTVDYTGAHVVIGAVSRFTARCIVSEVERRGEERASILCVDEAPKIYENIIERFGI